MSYEGATEYLCPKGHWSGLREDRYHAIPEPNCPCGERWVMVRDIDYTNGLDPDDPGTQVARRLEIGEEETEREDHRGNRYLAQEKLWAPEDPSLWNPYPTLEQEKAWAEEFERKEAFLAPYRDLYAIWKPGPRSAETLLWAGSDPQEWLRRQDELEKVPETLFDSSGPPGAMDLLEAHWKAHSCESTL